MRIDGLQKMTLLDFPGKVACTVFTGGCNFRCPFCHNALLVTKLPEKPDYSEDEILSFLEKRTGLLDGVAITGGEPLLNPDIADFIRKIRSMGYAVKLDTNGSFPERLKAIVGEGLVDYVAMDIKNRKEKYAETIGLKNLDLSKIEESVEFLKSGAVDYEFRTTVVEQFHTVEDIRAAAEWIGGAKRYFLQNFVDSGELICEEVSGVDKETMLKMKSAAADFVPQTEIRGI
ncbi:MAG: anaerobic ribonucleoside-triphosphate reductase activating protein [Clostridiaceae bacterium]|nr:anaerobic ribonucleoside-triphosphate reductase activating protein [Clostridiaceae bacterium]MDY5889437.1 anaerobic ribonucleoside-triphosphate reductase activating protein [Oscillospiraceae bacterium]